MKSNYCTIGHHTQTFFKNSGLIKAEEMTTVLKTTALGEIRGKAADGVVQYLGIKYATLRNRLADAELVERRDDGEVLDATKYG